MEIRQLGIILYSICILSSMIFPKEYYSYSPPFGEELDSLEEIQSRIGKDILLPSDEGITNIFLAHNDRYRVKKKYYLTLEEYEYYRIDKDINYDNKNISVQFECYFYVDSQELITQELPITLNGINYDTYSNEYYYIVHIIDNHYNYYIKAIINNHPIEVLRSTLEIALNELLE